ncbi:hypothetical protein DIPPA_16043 [Diplonema papillatum]|nr:hypothetical protein DIPPA_16043 [Diplonema papillatum]
MAVASTALRAPPFAAAPSMAACPQHRWSLSERDDETADSRSSACTPPLPGAKPAQAHASSGGPGPSSTGKSTAAAAVGSKQAPASAAGQTPEDTVLSASSGRLASFLREASASQRRADGGVPLGGAAEGVEAPAATRQVPTLRRLDGGALLSSSGRLSTILRDAASGSHADGEEQLQVPAQADEGVHPSEARQVPTLRRLDDGVLLSSSGRLSAILRDAASGSHAEGDEQLQVPARAAEASLRSRRNGKVVDASAPCQKPDDAPLSSSGRVTSIVGEASAFAKASDPPRSRGERGRGFASRGDGAEPSHEGTDSSRIPPDAADDEQLRVPGRASDSSRGRREIIRAGSAGGLRDKTARASREGVEQATMASGLLSDAADDEQLRVPGRASDSSRSRREIIRAGSAGGLRDKASRASREGVDQPTMASALLPDAADDERLRIAGRASRGRREASRACQSSLGEKGPRSVFGVERRKPPDAAENRAGVLHDALSSNSGRLLPRQGYPSTAASTSSAAVDGEAGGLGPGSRDGRVRSPKTAGREETGGAAGCGGSRPGRPGEADANASGEEVEYSLLKAPRRDPRGGPRAAGPRGAAAPEDPRAAAGVRGSPQSAGKVPRDAHSSSNNTSNNNNGSNNNNNNNNNNNINRTNVSNINSTSNSNINNSSNTNSINGADGSQHGNPARLDVTCTTTTEGAAFGGSAPGSALQTQKGAEDGGGSREGRDEGAGADGPTDDDGSNTVVVNDSQTGFASFLYEAASDEESATTCDDRSTAFTDAKPAAPAGPSTPARPQQAAGGLCGACLAVNRQHVLLCGDPPCAPGSQQQQQQQHQRAREGPDPYGTPSLNGSSRRSKSVDSTGDEDPSLLHGSEPAALSGAEATTEGHGIGSGNSSMGDELLPDFPENLSKRDACAPGIRRGDADTRSPPATSSAPASPTLAEKILAFLPWGGDKEAKEKDKDKDNKPGPAAEKVAVSNNPFDELVPHFDAGDGTLASLSSLPDNLPADTLRNSHRWFADTGSASIQQDKARVRHGDQPPQGRGGICPQCLIS